MTDTVSGEIWFKSKRAIRTAFTTLLTILPLVPQVIAIVQDQWSIEWLTAVGAQAVALNAALSRIIAIPVVDAWLTKVGLGSAPRGSRPAVDADELTP